MGSDSPTPVFSWQFLVLIAAMLGIVMSQPGTLPLSPASNRAGPGAGRAGEGLPTLTDSRLWADPYDTIPKEGAEAGGAASGAARTAPAVGRPEVTDGDLESIRSGQVCVMPVIVRGDSISEEAHEMRIRFRIAAAHGLGVSGFVPDDPNHLTWVQVKLRGGIPETFPVEWFLPGGLPRSRKSPYSAVLVAWVPDSVLFTNPLEQLQAIRCQLECQLRAVCVLKDKCPAFNVIGPYWSGTLVDILRGDLAQGLGITFYSSSATMADGLLDLLAPRADVNGPVGRERLRNPKTGPVLVNLTCTDEDLSESMLEELELRGIDPGDPDHRIAIISDSDTDYGRVLPLTFAAKYKQRYAAAHRGSPAKLDAAFYGTLKSDDAHTWPLQILRAYYLSGVEGTLNAGDGKERKPADESKTAPGSSSSAVALQRAEGEHQIDYVARLGRILSQRIDERNVQPADHGKLVAIGVLGADVYDKLLLIQALRPLFKDAIFFTDTLDARFMDPVKAIPFTRNLVISTSFGFDLFRNFQVGAPPFRSSEQTGAFLAVQAALTGGAVSLNNVISQLRPLRFEIGRTYPVSLNIPGEPRPQDDKSDLTGTVDRFDGLLHPPQEDFLPGVARIGALYLWPGIFAAICLGLLGVTIMFVLSGHIPSINWRRPRPWSIALASVGSLAALGLLCRHYDGIEPATWIQGVGIWPSEVVRFVAFATGLGSLLACHSSVRKSRIRLASEFGIKPPDKMPKDRTRFPRRFWTAIVQGPQDPGEYVCTYREAAAKYHWPAATTGDNVWPESPQSPPPSGTGGPAAGGQVAAEKFVIMEALWSNACQRSTVLGRNARTAAVTLFFVVGLVFLALATRFPSVPHRGDFSYTCDKVAVSLSSLMLIYLMFWVVDETNICLRFIKKLGRREPTIWPLGSYDRISSLRPSVTEDGVSDYAASSYLDVCFIGKLSHEAVPLIIMPFIVLTLMIIARWDFLANWRWETLILAIFGIDSAVCVCCAVRLRIHAVRAKERAIRQIATASAVARAAKETERADGLDSLRALMEGDVEGAYLPWHRQPFVSALLIPFGGSGGLGLIEYLLARQ